MKHPNKYPVKKTDTEWREQLNANEYSILRKKGTEPPFSGKYNNFFDNGSYSCKGCGQKLFNSK